MSVSEADGKLSTTGKFDAEVTVPIGVVGSLKRTWVDTDDFDHVVIPEDESGCAFGVDDVKDDMTVSIDATLGLTVVTFNSACPGF